jgi:predicted NUDIX family phosphoesterase
MVENAVHGDLTDKKQIYRVGIFGCLSLFTAGEDVLTMGKMDEMILAVERNYLFDDERLTFQGVITKEDPQYYGIMGRFKKYIEVRRGDAEVDSQWKQVIPYAIIRRGEEVFLYKRLKAGGEKRLHDQLSIGIGGHMNRINDVRNWDSNLLINFHRELFEELNINLPLSVEPEVVGLINDDNSDAGLYHIGILMVLDIPEDVEVSVKETDQLEGYWVRAKDLTKSGLFESLESWSQFAAEVL